MHYTKSFQALAESLSENTSQLLTIKCDLRSQKDIYSMFDVIKERWGGVDVCINNAGLALGPSVIEGDSEEWENMWQVRGWWGGTGTVNYCEEIGPTTITTINIF